MFTSAGNSTTMAAITAIPRLPWPNISSNTGAIATSGTDRSSIAIGMNANSNGWDSTKATAISGGRDHAGDEADAGIDERRPERRERLRAGLSAVSDAGRTPFGGSLENR